MVYNLMINLSFLMGRSLLASFWPCGYDRKAGGVEFSKCPSPGH